MPELPSGTITFLFTDVEGSTRLVKQLRDQYGEVLADHRRILRAAFEAHGGQEIDTQGDAFFVAFRRARDAALAAAEGQRGLAGHPWPEGAEVRVRMGLHTAEPTVGDEGYHGFGVHRAARIMAAGHGGQILVSQSTCSVLEDDELPGLHLGELGEYRLKDLDRPERLYQLDVEGLPQEFPPLRTAEAPTAYTGLEDNLEEAARATVWQARFWTRRRLAVGAAAALVAAGFAVGLALVLGGTAQALSHVDANAVGLISPGTNRIADQVKVGSSPSHLAVGEGAVWVTNAGDHTVSRIDPVTFAVVDTIQVGNGPSGVAVGGGAVWVANSLDGTVSRIDPGTNQVVQTIDVGNGPVGVAFGAHSVWVANTSDDTISRIAAVKGTVAATLETSATELAFGAGSLWASARTANSVSRIDPATRDVIETVAVGNGPAGLAFVNGAMWVANSLDGTVSRIDPTTGSVTDTIQVGDGPSAVAVGAGGVWVSNEFGGTVVRIDPATKRVAQRISVGNRPRGVAVSKEGRVLVSVLQSGAGHRGGTLTLPTSRTFSVKGTTSIDTAVTYDTLTWAVLNMTGDGLVGFVRAGGSEGTQLVPDLAVSLPAPTDSGQTYNFRLRPNIHYSTGALVKPADIRHALERVFELRSPGNQFYEGIVGGEACAKAPRRCDLSRGIVTGANTVTFHLTSPDPEFLYKLALPFAYAVPAGVPARETGTHPLPATGPYVIASYRPKSLVRFVRNKYFHEWSQAAQPDGYPDEIVVKLRGTADEALATVERGKADAFNGFQSGPPSTAKLTEAKTRFASQVHTNPQAGTLGFFLNTRLRPFDDVNVRRALNYAADRAAAVQLQGGPDLAQPTCQILPPNFPGYRPYCRYTADRTPSGTPDVAKARRLVAASGTRGMAVTVWAYRPFQNLGPYGAKLLRSLGYRASVKVLGDEYFDAVGDSRSRPQIGFVYWIADYPAASDFFNVLLSCGAFRPATPLNQNLAEFCDHSTERTIDRALRVQATNPQAASKLWQQVDVDTVDQAPWVPLITPKQADFLSKRVGNYQYSPQWGMLIDQLWVK